jgi:oligosaccharide repeat unit polymerase
MYRQLALGLADGEDSIIFGNGKIQLLYFMIISPMTLSFYFIGCAIYIKSGESRLILFSSLLLFMNAVITLGRFPIYLIILFSVVVFFIRNRGNPNNKLNLKGLFLLLLMSGAILGHSYWKQDEDESPLLKLASNYLVNYHTMSFAFYDLELQEKDSMLNNTLTYGRASSGGIDTVAVNFIRLFDKSFQSAYREIGVYLQEFRVFGVDPWGRPILGNAFASILYSLYIDGGIVAIGGFGFAFGLSLAYCSIKFRRDKNVLYGAICFLLLYVGIFGIFQPVLMSPIFLSLFFIVIMFKLSFCHYSLQKISINNL